MDRKMLGESRHSQVRPTRSQRSHVGRVSEHLTFIRRHGMQPWDRLPMLGIVIDYTRNNKIQNRSRYGSTTLTIKVLLVCFPV
jgi:hypothetical protein